MDSSADELTDIDRLADAVRSCRSCELCETRTQVVFGEGPSSAELMLVGEAPGASEDLEGRPFVGRSGRLLDELLAEVGLSRRSVFITNLVKCRPPENRDPKKIEVESCSHWLVEQLQIVRPRVVAPLGNHATRMLRQGSEGIMAIHGKLEAVEVSGLAINLFPLIHPAAALRSTQTRNLLASDLELLAGLLAANGPDC